jgi:hypothetical protein
VAAVQLGRRIRASVSRLDESAREETSVNAKPNDPLRTFHGAALNCGVDITKNRPSCVVVDMWQTSGIIGRTFRFCGRFPDFKLNAPCVRLRSDRFGGAGHKEAPRNEFLFLLKL